jgi:hypothetical protein
MSVVTQDRNYVVRECPEDIPPRYQSPVFVLVPLIRSGFGSGGAEHARIWGWDERCNRWRTTKIVADDEGRYQQRNAYISVHDFVDTLTE